MMSWPNRLTVLRILLLTPFVILLLNSDEIPELRFAAMAVFAAMALCDLLDGHLARRLNQRTRLGAILDPLADKLVLVVSVILLTRATWPGEHTDYFIPKWVTITLLSKDAVILLMEDRREDARRRVKIGKVRCRSFSAISWLSATNFSNCGSPCNSLKEGLRRINTSLYH